MALSEGATKLQRALKNLRASWSETEPYWQDTARREFEKNHFREIEELTLATLAEVERLAGVLDKARRDGA